MVRQYKTSSGIQLKLHLSISKHIDLSKSAYFFLIFSLHIDDYDTKTVFSLQGSSVWSWAGWFIHEATVILLYLGHIQQRQLEQRQTLTWMSVQHRRRLPNAPRVSWGCWRASASTGQRGLNQDWFTVTQWSDLCTIRKYHQLTHNRTNIIWIFVMKCLFSLNTVDYVCTVLDPSAFNWPIAVFYFSD